MKRMGLSLGALLFTLTLCLAGVAAAQSPKVHITGPGKERPQWVGKAFTIGVAAYNFDAGTVEISSKAGVVTLPMAHKKTNYLTYTPTVSGEHTITATVTVEGKTRQWTSSVTILVYPVNAEDRAIWMVKTALACVGSTDAEKFVQYAHIDATADWCAAFIGWCAKQVKIPDGAGLQSIYAGVNLYDGLAEPTCATCLRNYRARFLATVLGEGETPRPGDLVFFIWGSKTKSQRLSHPGYEQSWHGNASHVGIVTEVRADGFSFVHGNVRMKHNTFGVALSQSTDEKEEKTYGDWVVAFARPHYGYMD
ncbi:MAG TPA: hypothetical protein PLP25_02050 [Candidatus Limiplasma sp.]|nr:hypothetical protein [Candidatus Limiplasma sp.]HPS80629.1 hypothetical protein [Candidatus Limiplasma sp.]